MSWKNVKTFLILLFLCIDIYLLAITYHNDHAKELTDDNIYATWTLLGKNNIAIDKNIIPKQALAYETIELTSLPDSEGNNGVVTISENAEVNSQNANAVIKDILGRYGINTKNLFIKEENNTYYITETHRDMRLFNNKLAAVAKDGKVTIEGTWYNYRLADSSAGEQSYVYATSALIAFISRYNGSETEITDITCGYYALTDQSTSNAKSISAAPCYRLTDKQDRIYYYNILDNSFIE